MHTNIKKLSPLLKGLIDPQSMKHSLVQIATFKKKSKFLIFFSKMLWLFEFDDYERMNPLPLIKYFMTHFSIQNRVDNHFLGEGRIRAE